MTKIPNLFSFSKGGKGDFLEIRIWILPFDRLRVVSLSNHLLFVYWYLEFSAFEHPIALKYT